MAASDSRYSITKLDGENYLNWRFKMEMLLKEKKVWLVISQSKPDPVTTAWTENDEKAFTTIALTIEDSQIQHIRNCTTAVDAWNALKEVHEKDTHSNRVRLLRLIMKEHLEEGGDAEAHVNRMNELFQKLLALGTELKPEFFMCATLLATLPSSYDPLVTALEARNEIELTSPYVRSKIIEEYKRRKERDSSASDTTALKVNSNLNRSKEFHCFFCKEEGHIRRNCSKYKEWLKKKSDNTQKANAVEEATSNTVWVNNEGELLFAVGESDFDWIMDSGATCHIVCKKDNFVNLTEHEELVSVADKRKVLAIGKGSIVVNTINQDGKIKTVKLENVLYAPDIGGNLISVKLTNCVK